MMVYDEERGGEQWDMNCFFGYLQEVYDGIDSCDGYVNLLIYLEQGTPEPLVGGLVVDGGSTVS